MVSFDPFNLTPDASINRVKFMELPGLPDELCGQTAYQLLGRQFLIERILAQFPDLQTAPDIPLTFDAYLAAGQPQAEAIAATSGRYLGYLLLTLKRGDPANRAARPDWDDSHWQHWSQIERIIIGGGLMSGHLGQRILATASDMLQGLYQIERSTYGSALPLLGLARRASPETRMMRVFDFGQTAVKVGRAHYDQGTLVRLERFPSLPAPQPDDGSVVLKRMLEIVSEVTRNYPVDPAEAPLLMCSIASYVLDGQPVTDGFYGRLKEVSANVSKLLTDEFSAAVGQSLTVRLMHDGTAAAQAYAGLKHTAVITMGTALGIGFAPPAPGFRPLELANS